MGTIADLTSLTAPATGDFFLARDTSDVANPDKKLPFSSVGILSLAQTWTAAQAFAAITATSVTASTFLTLTTSTATIASGVITATTSYVTVDTEAAAATDDLDTINGGADGRLLILQTQNGSRDVTVKNATGNIDCGSDLVLNGNRDTIMLIYRGAVNRWQRLSFADNV